MERSDVVYFLVFGDLFMSVKHRVDATIEGVGRGFEVGPPSLPPQISYPAVVIFPEDSPDTFGIGRPVVDDDMKMSCSIRTEPVDAGNGFVEKFQS